MRAANLKGIMLFVLAIIALTRSTLAQTVADKVVVVLGDSLSDTGNLLAFTDGKVPRPDVYFQGSFSSGPLGAWPNHVARDTMGKVEVHNYAYGAATACTYNFSDIQGSIPSVSKQVDMYLTNKQNATFAAQLEGKDRVVVIWGGHNDLLAAVKLPPAQAINTPRALVGCLTDAVTRLLQSGETAIMLANLAPLGLTPAVNGTPVVGSLIRSINMGIRASVLSTKLSHPLKQIGYWNINADLTMNITNYSQLNFTYGNTTSCVVYGPNGGGLVGAAPASDCQTTGQDPNKYVFFDPLHPTSKAHDLIAHSLQGALLGYKIWNAPMF